MRTAARAMECLLCSLKTVTLAVPREEMVEIVEVPRITGIPGSHAWLTGVTEIRNRLTWVIALDSDPTPRTKLVRIARTALKSGESSADLAIAIDTSTAFASVMLSAATQESPLRFTAAARGPGGPVWLLDVRALLEANQ